MGNKVLVKADVTQLQTVGGGSGPSAMDLFNAVRGRGKTPGSTVGVAGRAAGLAGLAGKGAALGATALNTADALQAGNIAAPLGAGYTYQGLDPTGAMTAGQIQGTVPQAPQTPAPIPQNYSAPVMPPAHQPRFTPEGNRIPTPQNYTPAPAPAAPAPAAPAPAAPAPAAPAATAPAPAATAPAPAATAPAPVLNIPAMMEAGSPPPVGVQGTTQQQVPPVGVQGTTQQQVPPVAVAPQVAPQVARPGQPLTPEQMRMNGITGPPPAPPTPQGPIQNIQEYNGSTPPSSYNERNPLDEIYEGQEWMARNNQKNAGEFTDMLFDLLGPDNLYKMTPYEIGELAAFMYIKTR